MGLQELFSLEAGVCVVCKLDCHSLVDRIRPLPVHQRRTYILEKAPQFDKHKKMYIISLLAFTLLVLFIYFL